MELYRVQLRPRSAWRTPWQADTLLGALCATAARTRGAAFLQQRLIDPMLAGRPPFVLSDAMPGDWLPVPAAVRLDPPADVADRKRLKKLRWIPRTTLSEWRQTQDQSFPWQRCATNEDLLCTSDRRHNTLSRESDASLPEGGLFSKHETRLTTIRGNDANADGSLTLYARAADEASLELFWELLEELSWTGFGADASAGCGQFELLGPPRRDAELSGGSDGEGVMVLSTFQPGPGDPVEGCWESFAKFPRLGPDFGLDNDQVRKHTLIMFRPGACFRGRPRPFLGRALPMDRILPAETVDILRAREIEVVHPAFGLAVPVDAPRW